MGYLRVSHAVTAKLCLDVRRSTRIQFRVLVGLCWVLIVAVAAWPQAAQPLITQAINESQLTVLKGNTHPLAQAQFDQGAAPASLSMNRMLLVLKRSPLQDAALRKLIDDQQDRNSPNYHKWLTPEQFGQQFGPSDQDIQTITGWLQSSGFQIGSVSKGRTVIEFSGTAGQVQQAFHTAIHSYSVNGEQHWANASDPAIPTALAPAVAGIESLNNFPRKANSQFTGIYKKSATSAQVTPVSPLFTFPGGCDQDNNCYALGPYDFAAIYNVLPLWQQGIDGTGQTIAIVGRTNINIQDVRNFRSLFGLAANDPQIILNGPDPGINADEGEADIDVQWSGAVAPKATIKFVTSESTETTDGVDLSALYIVDNNLAPVMSESYGDCELALGTAGNQFFSRLWEQAAAQGITVFVSSGDEGSAGCDINQGAVPQPAQFGLAVSGIASTPFNVAVGGTDFNDFSNPQTYWNTTNDPTTQASAKGYIPETAWNDTCTNGIFATVGFSTNAETNCNNSQLIPFVWTVAGSGGASNCTVNSQTPGSCTGKYSKPSWQTGTGVPSDGARDLPDVSLFASNGFVGNFYVVCQSDTSLARTCDLNSPYSDFAGYGGTSVASPAYAGIMALVNQKMGVRQGNANYVLYKLAAKQTPASCNSNAMPASSCAFNDITSGTIATPCVKGSPNCTTANTAHQYGVLSGYSTTTGYDLASGLGSVNATNLVNNWSSVTFTPTTTTLSLNSGNPVNITHGQAVSLNVAVAPSSGTGTPSGDVSLLASTGQSVDGFTLSSGSVNATTSLLPGGTYTLTAHYGGDGTFGGSDSTASPTITVTPENSKTTLNLEAFNPTTGVETNSNVTSATYGQSFYLLRMNVTNSSGTACAPSPGGQLACPTGTIAFTDNGKALDGGNFTLNSLGYTEDQTINVTGGSHNLQAQYGGDASFNTSTGNVAITISPATTSFTEFSVPATASAQAPVDINATISASSFGAEPGGAITFFSDGTPISAGGGFAGSSGTTTGTATYSQGIQTSFSSAGTHTITATYSGDANYSSATSQSATIQVGPPIPRMSITPAYDPIQPGTSVTLTTIVDAIGPGPTITGTVSFTDIDSNPISGTLNQTQGTDSSGNPELTATFTFKPLKSVDVVARYSGDANYGSAIIPMPALIVVNFPNPTVIVAPVTVQAGSAATLTALVSAMVPGPVMTGTVTFKDSTTSSTIPGTVSLTPSTDSNGNPTLQASLTFTPAADQSFFASYSGDSTYPASQSGNATITVSGNDFMVSVPPALIVSRGVAGQTTLTIGAQSGYNGTITFSSASCSGLPAEATCSFNPASVTGSGTTVISVAATLPHARTITQADSFRASHWWALTGGGMLSCVLLAGLPKKRRWSSLFCLLFFASLITSASCGGGGSSGSGGGGLSDPGTPTGNYTVTVTAASNTNLTHTVSFQLTVQ